MENEEVVQDTTYELNKISSGVAYLVDGYVDYAKEVICGRALPDLYDGLKPVNRRILAMLHHDKVTKTLMKSSRIAGNVMGALHPHGDGSIYQAMVLMTDVNGSLAFPTIEGNGNFGGVYKDDPPAAMRYTEAKLHSNSAEYFGEMSGIEMVPNFDSTMLEPRNLPVSFPAVLVNSTSGIAVGFRSNIPSFNFNDVCDLVIEYINDGECHTIIEPDFVTGGYYIHNKKELLKLMKGGTGKIKLRGRTHTDGQNIYVSEVPYGKTIQKLISQINNLETKAIKNAYDTDDYENSGLTILCTSKKRVDEAFYEILKSTDLQYTYTADITVVKDGAPVRLGVWSIIEEWVKWRREVLLKEFNTRYDDLKESLRESIAFMNIVNAREKCAELTAIIVESGKSAGEDYIRENWTREEVPEDLIKLCASRGITSYYRGGKYAEIYANGEAELKEIQNTIDNIDDYIKSQMERLKSVYGQKMARRTEITTKDFDFVGGDDAKAELDNSPCVFEFADGFLKKLNYASESGAEYVIEGNASDTLIAFDNRGRLLRVYCQDLAYCSYTDIGTYLPSYFGLDETDDYKITWIGKLTGDTLMLLYRDGNIGFVDTSEWVGNNRNVRVLQKGIATTIAPLLGHVFTEIPEILYVSDDDGNISWIATDDVKRKDRTAKTRAFDLRRKNCLLDSYWGTDRISAMTFILNSDEYEGKLREIKNFDDIQGDVELFKDLMR